jgi:hypothetical protein
MKIFHQTHNVFQQESQLYSEGIFGPINLFWSSPPLLIEVLVSSEWSCICVLEVSILPPFMIYLLDFWIVSRQCAMFVFHLITKPANGIYILELIWYSTYRAQM